jgi:hypothetical protein
LPSNVGGSGVTTSEHLSGRPWREVLRAYALLSAAVTAVDRVLGYSNNSDADPQIRMALTETSHATHRALVKLAEVRETLANFSQDNPSQETTSENSAHSGCGRLWFRAEHLWEDDHGWPSER